MSSKTIGLDQFASAITDIVERLDEGVRSKVPKATEHATRVGARAARENAAGHGWSEGYSGGFSSRVSKAGGVVSGEVGNKTKPGLVHLLEKGHNTLTGRRTQAYPHMGPALETMEGDFEEQVGIAVDEAIGEA